MLVIYSVEEFLIEAFNYVNLNYKEYVKIDPRYFSPTEVELLLTDSSKTRRELSWSPRITFKELVKIMVDKIVIWNWWDWILQVRDGNIFIFIS